jgi:hypothetical protein
MPGRTEKDPVKTKDDQELIERGIVSDPAGRGTADARLREVGSARLGDHRALPGHGQGR